MKTQILAEIKKHLDNIDNEIVGYGFSLNITTKKDKGEFSRDYITISKNHSNGYFCPPYTGITGV